MTTDDRHDDDPGAAGPGLSFLGRVTASGINTPDDLAALLVDGGVPAEQVTQQTMVIVTCPDGGWMTLVPHLTDGAVVDSWYIHQYREEHQVRETRQNGGGVAGLVAASFARPIRVNGSRPDPGDFGDSEGSEGGGRGDGAL